MKRIFTLFYVIRKFISFNKIAYILFIVAQIITVFSISYFYCVNKDRNLNQVSESDSYNTMQIITNQKMTNETINNIVNIKTINVKNIEFLFSDQSNIIYSKLNQINTYNIFGDNITKNNVINKDNVVIIPKDYMSDNNVNIDDTITIINKSFKVIGINNFNYFEIPYTTMIENNISVNKINLILKQPFTESDCNKTLNKIKKYINIEDYKFPDFDKEVSNRMIFIMIFSIFIYFLALINYSYLYKYVLETRKKNYAILKLVGFSNIFEFITLFVEMFLIYVFCFVMGIILYLIVNNYVLNILFNIVPININFIDILKLFFILLFIQLIFLFLFSRSFVKNSPILQLKESE